MTRTPSTMLTLGTEAPDFRLPDTTAGGKEVALSDFEAAPALLVVFICNHCPFVQHVAGELAALSRDLPALGVPMVAISSNDAAAYQADSPAARAEEAARQGWSFPYLHDETQDVAKAYRAACPPDFILVDGERRLGYRGQLATSRPAIDAVLPGRPVPEDQRPTLACNIKWKPGNDPEYA